MIKIKEDLNVKYRPRKFNDVVGNRKIVEMIERMIEEKRMVDMIFYGRYGIGKTTLAKIIANEVSDKMDIIHLNASMMTKKSQVEENVINASKYSIMSSSRYKTIILDESERLSSYSQDSLKSWLETKNKRVIVIFIVNDLSKMIDAIRSRCLVLNFVSPTKEEIKENLYRIIEEEDVEIDDHTLNEILKESRGDVRKSVVLLQQFMNGGSFEKKSLNLLDFFKLIVSKEIIKAYEFLYDLFSENRPSYVIDQLFEYFLEKKKPKFVLYLANLEDSINRGGNMRIAIMKFCVMMSNGK